MSGPWTLEPFVADDGSVAFGGFMSDLSEGAIDALDLAVELELVLTVRGIDLVSTEWLKPLGGGLHEFRIRHEASEVAHMFGGSPEPGPKRHRVLLRVFVHFHGDRVVLLLGGYEGKGPEAAAPGARDPQGAAPSPAVQGPAATALTSNGVVTMMAG